MNRSLLRGSLETIVIKLLSDNNEMYGYEITQKVEEVTQGKIKLTYGALYPILHKLENLQWLNPGLLFVKKFANYCDCDKRYNSDL